MRYLWGGKLTHFNRKQQWHFFLSRAHETCKYTSTYNYSVLEYAIFHFTWVVLNSGDDFKGYTIFISLVTPSAFKPWSLSYKIIKHYRIIFEISSFQTHPDKNGMLCLSKLLNSTLFVKTIAGFFWSSLNAQVPSFCVMLITCYISYM